MLPYSVLKNVQTVEKYSWSVGNNWLVILFDYSFFQLIKLIKNYFNYLKIDEREEFISQKQNFQNKLKQIK